MTAEDCIWVIKLKSAIEKEPDCDEKKVVLGLLSVIERLSIDLTAMTLAYAEAKGVNGNSNS